MNPLGPSKIIELKEQYLYPCAHHFYKHPPQIVRGEMQYLYDHNDKTYLDFYAGVSVTNCGHCNPVILEATIEQLKTLQHTTTIYLTQPMVELAEKLSSVLPGNIKRSFFCTSGTEANEGALLLARLYTGKSGIIALENGLHGRSHLTMNVTGIPMWRTDPFLDNNVHFAKSIASAKGTLEERAQASIDSIKTLIETHHDIGAFIAEPIQGNGGIITPPDWYFKKIKALLDSKGILFICDEIQTGFARSGKMFAIETYDVVPDIITIAKALGNGMPISAFCTNDEIASAFSKPSASTFGGNPVASKTALSVLEYIENNDLCEHAQVLGKFLRGGLEKLTKEFDCLVETRGKGLMLGVEVQDTNSKDKALLVDEILEDMMNKGFLIGKNGLERNVLAFQPPLIITKENIVDLLNALKDTLEKLCPSPKA